MAVYHDASDHIKQRIKDKHHVQRDRIKNEAQAEAERRIAEKEAEAKRYGEQRLTAQKKEAEKVASQHYHTKKAAVWNDVESKKKRLHEELRSQVWATINETIDEQTIHEYLETRLKDALTHNEENHDDYDITRKGTTPETKMITATNGTKKYKVQFKALVNENIETYWHTLVDA